MFAEALVTIVVTPRDRYSAAVRSLATVIENTKLPHRLVYVSGGDPPHVLGPLREMCRRQEYELIERPEYLGSNAARNLGLARVSTPYVVFVENDVIVEPGWLDSLMACAEDTGAAIVGPLILYGEPDEGFSHSAGGDFTHREAGDHLVLVEHHRLTNVDLRAKLVTLRRSRCDFIEFHCGLVRRSLFDRIGPLDEAFGAAAENIDLCLLARGLGESVYVEPDSVVSIVAGEGVLLGDTDFWAVRWSEAWFASSMRRFAEKWRLPPDASFLRDYWSQFHRYRERGRVPPVHMRSLGPGSLDRHALARTIDELAGQMSGAGYAPAAVSEAHAAYATAESLIAGVYRDNRTTQLAHALGTASVLAAYGAPQAVVAAGVLHGVYAHGCYPEVVQDLAGARRWLRREIGGPTEAQVWDYHGLCFEDAEAAVRQGRDHVRLVRAYSILIRIAHAVDEQLRHGRSASADAVVRSRARIERWAAIFASAAEGLHCRPMLDLLLALSDEAAARSCAPAPASTPIARPPGTPWRQPLGLRRRAYRLSSLTASHGAVVTTSAGWPLAVSGDGPVDLVTGPSQWSYAATLALHEPDALRGESTLSVELCVSEGRLGVGVLWVDCSDRYVVPELSAEPSDEHVELHFALAEVREAGHLVFRSWTPGPTKARILSVSVHETRARPGS
jgi:GT2 family glycosyltransferase